FVLQHSPKIKEYFSIIKEATNKKELDFQLYSMMYDRLLMQEGKEQIYGTQAYGFTTYNPEGKPERKKMFIWPIQNPEKVNQIRKEAGFDTTIEEYAQRMGIEYKLLTLENVKEMQKSSLTIGK
ncbi:MAG TPA: hypothetical protein VL859_13520, partial [Flavobacterium sp.]|nr:hypothetical protein [Flavobacterium sp.]